MKAFYIFLSLLMLQCAAYAQFSKHIVVLTDKNNSPYALSNPGNYLSAKAIDRRTRYGVTIDSTDLPVNPAYIDAIAAISNVTILNSSKWLNQVLIQTSDAAALTSIQQLPFVKRTQQAAPRTRNSNRAWKDKLQTEILPIRTSKKVQDVGDYFNYGNNYDQVKIHEGNFLHNNGFRGEGMTIAVLDAGFYRYDTNPAFDSIVRNNQVLGTWDFVANKTSVTEEHDHGMICFSTISANRPGKIVGTAPKAKYYLFRTEDVNGEYQIEEQNWVAAAERADSLGVDLITSSLGYYTFDDNSQNYTYADMTGKTTIITRGAEYAFKKGMIVTNSAGNSGGEAWRYIIAPADGEHVLAVGATNGNGEPAWFSSYGPTADDRIKPDVASVGAPAVIADHSGNPGWANGTSVANPNMAGLVTCLWQAFPEFNNQQVIDAVRKSGSKFNSPDDRVGYGIPNMRIAYQLLEAQRTKDKVDRILEHDWMKAFPVPFSNRLNVLIKPSITGVASMEVLNEAGSLVLVKKDIKISAGIPQNINLDALSNLAAGVYWIKYDDGINKRILKVIKQ